MSENCLKAACPDCDVTFAIAALPLDVGDMIKHVNKASCPECGKTSKQGLLLNASDTPPDYPLEGSANKG